MLTGQSILEQASKSSGCFRQTPATPCLPFFPHKIRCRSDHPNTLQARLRRRSRWAADYADLCGARHASVEQPGLCPGRTQILVVKISLLI